MDGGRKFGYGVFGASDDRFRLIAENVNDLIAVLDRQGMILYSSPSHKRILGYEAEYYEGKSSYEFIHPDDLVKVEAVFADMFESKQAAQVEIRFKSKEGWKLLEERGMPVLDEEGNVDGFVTVGRDITERKEEERRLEESEQKYRSLYDRNVDAVFSFDVNGKFTGGNAAWEQITGYTEDELIVHGRTLHLIAAEDAERITHHLKKALLGETQFFEMTVINKSGQRINLSVTNVPIINKECIVGVFGIAKDITKRKRDEHMIYHLAYYDSLTGLPNRRMFLDRLQYALDVAEQERHLVAVMMLDLDRFKVINESLGHAIGDQILQEVAIRLQACIDPEHTVARLGGDEFALLLPKLSNADHAVDTANSILKAFQKTILIAGYEFHITSSIGISLYPDDGVDANTLLKHADTAMYIAKEQGKNNFQWNRAGKNEQVFAHMELENDLRKALDLRQFVVYYQPQINIQTGLVFGVEALVRWLHPERGLVSPGQFIPLAEETGLIAQISEWVLREACRQARQWQVEKSQYFKVSVNLSSSQFQQINLVDKVRDILRETGLHPQYLDLEITESIAMHNIDYVVSKLTQLEHLGVHISIDDFGTGFSSLSYLKKFPIHTLKIDRSFIQDITTDPDDASIVTAIRSMARSLNLDVVVEGVETIEQLEFLRTIECDKVQGFYYCKPVPAREFERLVVAGTLKI
ncbi:sensor domain-containing protein [Tumebacillus permanentifrigoris]|uniref:PAS domain S-box-containing protein/diguanylate cyclase (GGDEF)-like protein n=1 Tax=Tumebacillus permanentifrigoris TaxID=378543 RepID=A0A316D8E2_9BACL|nr:bifunctional diguanylate cyclase/phosphodiesterase [Tumebacillus permanentifrigoris]PWK13056.1 PAS domain S-box-containing protein/diguanylate cyclase (GGDEF)-like protein [Tumebacillus permanentifrigoris]